MAAARKPGLSKPLLEQHGITYSHPVYVESGERVLPDHVNTVREGILDFKNFLIKNEVESSLKEVEIGEELEKVDPSAFKNPGLDHKEWDKARCKAFIAKAHKVSTKSQELRDNNATEPGWQLMFNTTIFSNETGLPCDILNIDSTDNIACTNNAVTRWTESHSIKEMDEIKTGPSAPQPDIYCGFRIHDLARFRDYGFAKDDLFQNFSVETISQLASVGLSGVPTKELEREVRARRKSTDPEAKLTNHHLLCFPWLVIELKRQDKKPMNTQKDDESSLFRVAHCQAANGASVALCMMEKLASFAIVEKTNAHIPPVVTMTCVGGKTKVWLAYSNINTEGKRDHHMICIWEGYSYFLQDSIKLCRIVENIYSWAKMILRPKISHYIQQWRDKHFPRQDNLRAQLQLDPELMSTVQKIDEVLSSLKTTRTSNLVDVADLIVGLRDAMVAYPRKLQASWAEEKNEEEKQKSEGLVASGEPSATLLGTSVEKGKLSDLSLRDFTDRLQQLGVVSTHDSPRRYENIQLSNARISRQLSRVLENNVKMDQLIGSVNKLIFEQKAIQKAVKDASPNIQPSGIGILQEKTFITGTTSSSKASREAQEDLGTESVAASGSTHLSNTSADTWSFGGMRTAVTEIRAPSTSIASSETSEDRNTPIITEQAKVPVVELPLSSPNFQTTGPSISSGDEVDQLSADTTFSSKEFSFRSMNQLQFPGTSESLAKYQLEISRVRKRFLSGDSGAFASVTEESIDNLSGSPRTPKRATVESVASTRHGSLATSPTILESVFTTNPEQESTSDSRPGTATTSDASFYSFTEEAAGTPQPLEPPGRFLIAMIKVRLPGQDTTRRIPMSPTTS